jgi:hypothetical protein
MEIFFRAVSFMSTRRLKNDFALRRRGDFASSQPRHNSETRLPENHFSSNAFEFSSNAGRNLLRMTHR